MNGAGSNHILRRWLGPPGTHPNHLRNGGSWSPREGFHAMNINECRVRTPAEDPTRPVKGSRILTNMIYAIFLGVKRGTRFCSWSESLFDKDTCSKIDQILFKTATKQRTLSFILPSVNFEFCCSVITCPIRQRSNIEHIKGGSMFNVAACQGNGQSA